MKKLMGILLAVMLCVLACAAFADEVPQAEAGKKFESDWACLGGRAEIYYEEQGYRIMLTIEKDNNSGSVWEYSCYYHEDTDSLVSATSSRTDFTISSENGERVYGVSTYEGFDDKEHYAEFTIDQDGCLIWNDHREDAGAGLKFANIGRFEGLWKNQKEEVEVQFMWNGLTADEMFYTVYITRGKTDGDTYTQFLMNGTYDPATGKLSANGTCTTFKKNADGKYDSSDDGESYDAVFSKAEDWKLLFETENGIELEYDLLGVQG